MVKVQTGSGAPPVAMSDGLRSRARRAMRTEVAAVAMELFLEQGFDNTTVEQIAAAAGMSRSSFFRYFPTKEDVVVGRVAEYGQQMLESLTERPDTEPVWTSLRSALESIVQTNDVARARQTSRMFTDTPALKARHYEKTLTWEALLLPEVGRRLGLSASDTDPRPAALISCALACLDAAIGTWTSNSNDAPLGELLDLAMISVGPQPMI